MKKILQFIQKVFLLLLLKYKKWKSDRYYRKHKSEIVEYYKSQIDTDKLQQIVKSGKLKAERNKLYMGRRK